MAFQVPHPIPYQGSKRRLAATILKYFPSDIAALVEPFAGSAAITLAAAVRGRARWHVIGDSLPGLINLWRRILSHPKAVADEYERLWNGQLKDPRAHYLKVRAEFNKTGDPVRLLYLMARCVKNAVRFNPNGDFNQSADHRRKGMNPKKMRSNVKGAAQILAGKCEVVCGDFTELLEQATRKDLVYMDPPYQGVTNTPDHRYHQQLSVELLSEELEQLNQRGIRYLLSYDGSCGDKKYGVALPKELQLTRLRVRVGKSAQATLAGRSDETVESLYLSPSLASEMGARPATVSVGSGVNQRRLAL